MKKLIQRWPKPLASFAFKTCYSSTVQVILPKGLDSTCLHILHNSPITHEHFPPPVCPRGHGIVQTQLDKHTKPETVFSFWQSHGSFWCDGGGEQQELLFIIPYQSSRGTEGRRKRGCCAPWGWAVCPWQPLGFSCLSHAAFSPWISQAGTWWFCCYATAGSQTEQILLPSPSESPSLLFSKLSHQLPIKARGLSSGFIALLYLWDCGWHVPSPGPQEDMDKPD